MTTDEEEAAIERAVLAFLRAYDEVLVLWDWDASFQEMDAAGVVASALYRDLVILVGVDEAARRVRAALRWPQ